MRAAAGQGDSDMGVPFQQLPGPSARESVPPIENPLSSRRRSDIRCRFRRLCPMAIESELTIRPYRSGDEHAILRTFNFVFREVCGPSFVDRDLASWRWQFLENPWGYRIWLAVTPDGEVVAQYAGVPYPMTTAAGDCLFIHIVDSFVHPDYRKGLKRSGVFVHTVLPFFADCHDRGDAVLYGFPLPAAERIGKRLLDYKRLCVVDYLCRDLSRRGPRRPRRVEVDCVDILPLDIDSLFERFSPRTSCLTRRNAAYLTWRYLSMPGSRYEIWTARRGGELRGLMVLRPIHELLPNACTIADWMVVEDDKKTTDALVAVAAERGRAHHRQRLLAVFSNWGDEHAALLQRGFDTVPSANYLERPLAYRIHHPNMSKKWLQRNWWYTLGDSDLV